jgi:UDP-N-acetylmuramate: L-alanyl-gamma-D-glutamyl-meso-diaminopimelate ligase
LPKQKQPAKGRAVSEFQEESGSGSLAARLDQLAPEDRLNPEKVVADIAAKGKPAFYEPTADAIIEKLKPLAQSGDVVVVFSNGGFDGIHGKLLQRLA